MSRNLPVVPRPAADRPDLLRPRRRSTPSVSVGGVLVGSAHPIVVQSMTNTDTADAVGTAAQVAHLARAGSQIVRVTVNNEEAAAAVPEIVRRLAAEGVTVPIVGDFHYYGHKLLAAYPATAAALRIQNGRRSSCIRCGRGDPGRGPGYRYRQQYPGNLGQQALFI